jgi:hypothetical protein
MHPAYCLLKKYKLNTMLLNYLKLSFRLLTNKLNTGILYI